MARNLPRGAGTPHLAIIRELQGLSQNEVAQRAGISQATISGIENDRVTLGVERAKALAQALKCHPGVLVFPRWVVPTRAAAQQPVAADGASAAEPATLYQRHGFEVLGTIQAGTSPPIVPMVPKRR